MYYNLLRIEMLLRQALQAFGVEMLSLIFMYQTSIYMCVCVYKVYIVNIKLKTVSSKAAEAPLYNI